MFPTGVKMQVAAAHPDAGSLYLRFGEALAQLRGQMIEPIDASRVHESPLQCGFHYCRYVGMKEKSGNGDKNW
jgi:hypothetical protein